MKIIKHLLLTFILGCVIVALVNTDNALNVRKVRINMTEKQCEELLNIKH